MNTVKKKTIICIKCPKSCRITAEYQGRSIRTVLGNLCNHGSFYAREEILDPVRILTCLMQVEKSERPLSVRSSVPIPKQKIFDCIRVINSTTASAPVQIGDILIINICNTGADIIATQNIP